MTKHYMILDLQTGEYSSYTKVQDIFETMVDDYMANDWSVEEANEIMADFDRMDEEEKKSWVYRVYEYQFREPGSDFVRQWEQDTGNNWYEETGIKVGGLTDSHIVTLKGIANELDILLMDLNKVGLEAFPEFDSEGAQALEDVYKGIRDKMEELKDFIEEKE